jgi:peroxiredoxin
MSGSASSQSEPKDGSRSRKLRRYALEALVVVAFVLGIRAYQTRDLASGQAPALAAPTLDGQRLGLAGVQGQPVALHFWASWCGVCSAMRHNVRSLAQGHRVISVASRSGDEAAVRSFVAQHPLDAPVIADPSGAIAQAYGVRAYPTTFFLDANGAIRHVEVGYTTELGLRLRLWSAGLSD